MKKWGGQLDVCPPTLKIGGDVSPPSPPELTPLKIILRLAGWGQNLTCTCTLLKAHEQVKFCSDPRIIFLSGNRPCKSCSEGPVTWCNFAYNLQSNSTLGGGGDIKLEYLLTITNLLCYYGCQ